MKCFLLFLTVVFTVANTGMLLRMSLKVQWTVTTLTLLHHRDNWIKAFFLCNTYLNIIWFHWQCVQLQVHLGSSLQCVLWVNASTSTCGLLQSTPPVIVGLSLDEEEGVANDSDASPPQSRGRGRFEKGRAKVGSRGQSDETRSTSSQAADEESSSHVRRRPTS